MEHLFIINPAAGKYDKTAEYTSKIETAFAGRDENYRIAVSGKPGDCTRIAFEAAHSGNEVRIYACGGDGTLNECIAGAAGHPNAAVTCFSGGSGNDFVKLFGDTAAFMDLDRLLECEEAEFDLIDCNGDHAVNICCVGLDARIGADMVRYKRLPMVSGSMSYILSTLVNVFRQISDHYVVEINGETIDADQTFICVCNGRYYGGGFNPVPEADPGDGMLDVLLVKKISRLQIPGIIGKYKAGRYAELPKIVKHYRTKHIRITCDHETPVNLDGEIRMAKTVDMRITGEKVRFFYPRGLSWKPAAKV